MDKKIKAKILANRKALAKLIPNAEDRENLGHILNEEFIKNDSVASLAFMRGEISKDELHHKYAYAMTVAHMAWQLGFDNIGKK